MMIIRDIRFSMQLLSILRYIAKDKKSATVDFESELNQKIKVEKEKILILEIFKWQNK